MQKSVTDDPARKAEWLRGIGLAIVVFVACDLLAAQAFKIVIGDSNGFDAFELEKQYRIASETFHHGLKPNTESTSRWGGTEFALNTNSLGFKDSEVREIALSTDLKRILFIGDSFTEGVGVPFEQTFVGILDQVLGEQGVDVLNAGCASYSPSIYYSRIKYLLEIEMLEFDELILLLDISDIHDEGVMYELTENGTVQTAQGAPTLESIVSQQESSNSWGEVLKANSVSLRLLDLLKDRIEADGWERLFSTVALMDELTNSPRSAWTHRQDFWESYGLKGTQEATVGMDKLLALLSAHGISLRLVVYPWPTQIVIPKGSEQHVEYWRNWSGRNDVAFLSLFTDFMPEQHYMEVLSEYFIPWDVHWNAKGHYLVAKKLESAIVTSQELL